MTLPDGYDPDLYVRERGPDAIRQVIRDAPTYYTPDPPHRIPPPRGRLLRLRAARQRRPPSRPLPPEEQARRFDAMIDNLHALADARGALPPEGVDAWLADGVAALRERERVREEARQREQVERAAHRVALMAALRSRARLLVWSAAHPGQPPPSQRREATPIDRASSYLAILPPSVSGSGGHDALWDAVIHTLHGFSLTEGEALSLLMSEFAPRCSPPWRRDEVAAKIRSARGAKCGRGWHLER